MSETPDQTRLICGEWYAFDHFAGIVVTCGLPLGHEQNHRGEARNVLVQWPQRPPSPIIAKHQQIVADLQAENARLREMLQRFEWSCDNGRNDFAKVCPMCGQTARAGHHPTCKMAAALTPKGETGESTPEA